LGHIAFFMLVWWWVQYQHYGKAKPIDPATVPWINVNDVSHTKQSITTHTSASSQRPLAQPKATPAATPPTPPPAVTTTEKPIIRAIPVDPVTLKPLVKTPAPTPQQAAPAPASSTTPQKPSADGTSEFISVSRADASLTGLNKLDPVDQAVRNAFHQTWNPPPGDSLSADGRTMRLEVAIGRSGQILSFKPDAGKCDEALRSSVLEAANRLATISQSLPTEFSGERYIVQIKFYIE
jgi:hypothetical protein